MGKYVKIHKKPTENNKKLRKINKFNKMFTNYLKFIDKFKIKSIIIFELQIHP